MDHVFTLLVTLRSQSCEQIKQQQQQNTMFSIVYFYNMYYGVWYCMGCILYDGVWIFS